MELTDLYPKCVIRDNKGNEYDSVFFGLFQFRNDKEEYPMAQVKLKNGSIGRVNPSNVFFQKVDFFTKADGTRGYFEG